MNKARNVVLILDKDMSAPTLASAAAALLGRCCSITSAETEQVNLAVNIYGTGINYEVCQTC